MRFKILTTTSELKLYQKLTSRYIDVMLPLPYLNQGRVYGCFNEVGRMCGGFSLITEAPFRVIQSIPCEEQKDLNFEMELAAEVTGLWLDSSMIKKNQSLRFWLKLYFELGRSGKKYFVYAYSLHKPKLGQIYQTGRPRLLFKGRTKVLPGMRSPDDEAVELVTYKNFMLSPIRSPDFIFSRLIGKRKATAPCYQASTNLS